MKCGSFKENAFRECARCEFVPQSEHEFAYSLGLERSVIRLKHTRSF